MKCEISRDLIALYAEGLCSPESVSELEVHIESCPECAKQLELYKQTLDTNHICESHADETPSEASLAPMKKVHRKLTGRKIAVITLSVLLLLILIGITYLSYGEATNRCLSFSAVADVIRVKNACEALAEGNIDSFAAILPTTYADNYHVSVFSDYTNYDEYMMALKLEMQAAYEYYFAGKEIFVHVDSLNQMPYDEVSYDDFSATTITVTFRSDSEILYAMTFEKMSKGKYVVLEDVPTDSPQFTAHLMSSNELLLESALCHTTKNQYSALLEGRIEDRLYRGYSLIFQKWGADIIETDAYHDRLQEALHTLISDGWYIKEAAFSLNRFDTTRNRWVYTVYFFLEEHTEGTICVLEQDFFYSAGNLFSMKECSPTLLGSTEKMAPKLKKLLLTMFE